MKLDSKPMLSQDARILNEKRKLQDWALLLIAGCFNGEHLRRGTEDSQIRRLLRNGGFASGLKDACEQIRPNVTKDASLLLELTAVEKKLSRLIV